jgi:Trk K+ transport system NAD-binding subunit
LQGPVLLCGLGRVGHRVLDCLRTAGVPVVAIDTRADPDDPRLFGVRVVRGDCRDGTVLREAGVHHAQGVIVVTSDDLVNISCALMVRRLHPNVRIVLRMFNQNLVTRLGKAVPNVTALSVSALTAPLLALTATTGDVLAAFPVGTQRRQVVDLLVAADSPLVGRRISDFDPDGRFLLLAHTPAAHAPRRLLDLDPTVPIEAGDRLVVCGTPADVRRLLEPATAEGTDVLWAGRIRRFGRVAYRTFAEMDLAVKICFITLLVVVAASTLAYRFALGHTWADGLYRTISVIATGADMGGREYEGWGKVFVSLLRIFGTVLVAAFTAIFTNYLIRARLGGVFEVRRIPDSGHVVVVGLGNVGFRVVEELARLGEQIVVIEQKADNSFAPGCRRLGVPIILGDATVRETLIQARVKEARAVVAATSSDLGNLEIALLVAEQNETQRVVVRLTDSVLAETARTAAGVKMAVSLPELAAPAFVAGLLGDRVLTMFQVGGGMLAVVEHTISEDDAGLLGRSLRAVAIDHGFVAVAVLGTDGSPVRIEPGYRLRVGDRLTSVTTMADLERLVRREPVPRTWTVEVTAFPLSAREDLVLRVRTACNLGPAEADAAVVRPPFVVARDQTRGEAEDLLAQLQREKVTARLAEG